MLFSRADGEQASLSSLAAEPHNFFPSQGFPAHGDRFCQGIIFQTVTVIYAAHTWLRHICWWLTKRVIKTQRAKLARHRRTAADVDEGETLKIETIVKCLEAKLDLNGSHLCLAQAPPQA